MEYGFLIWKGEILIDSEPCYESDGQYNLRGFPEGSCPLEKEGRIDNFKVRCSSWEAIYFEFFGYPKNEWKSKDFESIRIIEEKSKGKHSRSFIKEKKSNFSCTPSLTRWVAKHFAKSSQSLSPRTVRSPVFGIRL